MKDAKGNEIRWEMVDYLKFIICSGFGVLFGYLMVLLFAFILGTMIGLFYE